MTRSRKLALSGGLSLVVLAACGGGGGPIGDAVAQFGQSFATAFRALDNADPVEPGPVTYLQVADADLATRLTQEPVDF